MLLDTKFERFYDINEKIAENRNYLAVLQFTPVF